MGLKEDEEAKAGTKLDEDEKDDKLLMLLPAAFENSFFGRPRFLFSFFFFFFF